MPLKLLADENIDHRIVKELRDESFDVISIRERYGGISDQKVLRLSVKFHSILITEDRDFGEWIFAYQEKAVGVIYLRYNNEELEEIIHALKHVLAEKRHSLYGKFVVITPKKIRLRDIPYAV
ncbi:MAG: DUF5615 family PIN-like protein [Candidatus Aminicenantes bacterium]|nr:DUF5615 family PIN-like protein [Candidatus Aminicenantes bacterium]